MKDELYTLTLLYIVTLLLILLFFLFKDFIFNALSLNFIIQE